jgi:hypothetical protein
MIDVHNLQIIKNNLEFFGFVKLPGFFSKEFHQILRSFDRIMEQHTQEFPHTGEERSLFWQCADSDEFLCSLMAQERLQRIVQTLMGDNFLYTGSSGNYYAGNTGWHSDDIFQHKRIKVSLYLDKLDASNGALRVIPGTHRPTDYNFKFLSMIGTSTKNFGVHGSEIPAVVIDIEPGDIIIFNQNLIHSSWGGNEKRKMISLNFHEKYTSERMAFLENYVEEMARFMKPRVFGDALLKSADPALARMTAPIREMEDIYLASLAQKKEEGAVPSRDILPDMSDSLDEEKIANEYIRPGAIGDDIRRHLQSRDAESQVK